MIEKLKTRTVRLAVTDAGNAESAAELLRDVRGVLRVQVKAHDRLMVSYNVRRITLQIIEALLTEFDYRMQPSLFCRVMRAVCYYLEDIECENCLDSHAHDQAECTREAFIRRYIDKPHGCRDHRPEYLRRYL